MTSNAFVARFDATPALVCSEQIAVFDACLNQVSVIQTRLDADMTAPMMVDDFWFEESDWRSRLRPYVVKDGILQIPVKGVLLHDFPYQFFGWATGYAYIWRAFERGVSDSNVKGIALVIDSPGGEVAGNFDLVDKMFARRGEKPVRAYASESAYSAAYSIASVADTITVSRTGGVGSIGVVTSHVDVSKMMDRVGYQVTFIHAGKHKVDGNPYQPLPTEVKDRIQVRIDELYDVFVSTVARNRAMDEEVIRNTEALTFTATQAISNGLADAVGAFEDQIAVFARDLETENEDMTTQVQDTGGKPDAAANEAAVNTARAEGKAEGVKEGASAERTRITAIINSDEGKKRPVAALSAALETDMSAEQATKFLGRLAEEKPTAAAPQNGNAGFTNAMDNGQNPDLAAAGGEDGDGSGDKVSRHERALALSGRVRKSA